MGRDSLHRQGAGGVPSQGGPTDYRKIISEATQGKMVLPPPPPLRGGMQESGIEEVEVYITWRHILITQYIMTRPILSLCREA